MRFRKLYHFLGGIQFALLLISSVALFVIAGTLIESSTQSHRYAAQFTYSNPIFGLLLWGFFINILFAATRRWPFKIKHVPFLITHLGLLMILAGALAKHYFGIQGTMSIMEGGGSQDIFENGTYALHIEKQGDQKPMRFEIKRNFLGNFDNKIANTPDGLRLYLVDYAPHSTERVASWIKGGYASILGLNPMPVHHIDENSADIPLSGKVRFQKNTTPWDLYALQTIEVESLLKRLYLQGAMVQFTDRSSGKLVKEISLSKAVKTATKLPGHGIVNLDLSMDFSPIEGFISPMLKVEFVNDSSTHNMSIPLYGANALINLNDQTFFLGSLPITVDIVRQPALAIIEDEHYDCHLVAFNASGKIWRQSFRNELPDTLIAYNDGFRGYSVKAHLPFAHIQEGRAQSEAALAYRLKKQLQHALDDGAALSPPLQLFQQACNKAKVGFIENCVNFLTAWDNTHSWLYPEHLPIHNDLAVVLKQINWENIPSGERQGCFWSAQLFALIEPQLQQGNDLLKVLRKSEWPLLASLEAQRSGEGPCSPEESESLLTLMTQQIFAAAELKQLENNAVEALSPERHARLLTAYLRAYGIHLKTISTQPSSDDEMQNLLNEYEHNLLGSSTEPVIIETLLLPIHQAATPGHKLEDNFPKIAFQARKGKRSQTFSLAYDRYGTGLKWPVLDGEYIVRFQPMFTEIPYRVRLRNARQINYANSNQAYSYESDLIITDRRSGLAVEKSISMNNVHETWDGYRFYLASIAPANEGSVKRVQIVVNYDPAKYWLTYPGACILSLGIILLFTLRPYRKNRS